MLAAEGGHKKIVSILLNVEGIDVNAKNNVSLSIGISGTIYVWLF